MKYLAIAAFIFLIILVPVVIWLVWRWTSVERGKRAVNEKLLQRLDPIARRIEAGEPVSPEEIDRLAERPEIRHMLFSALHGLNRPDLLPTRFSSSIDQGAAALARWLMHPNELEDAPEKIEYLESIHRTVQDESWEFHIYRYKMPEGHWAPGWLLGFAGPMENTSEEPYSYIPGAFSRAGDVEGKITPAEIIDWYLSILRRKKLIN